jgi:hypothetical protein
MDPEVITNVWTKKVRITTRKTSVRAIVFPHSTSCRAMRGELFVVPGAACCGAARDFLLFRSFRFALLKRFWIPIRGSFVRDAPSTLNQCIRKTKLQNLESAFD